MSYTFLGFVFRGDEKRSTMVGEKRKKMARILWEFSRENKIHDLSSQGSSTETLTDTDKALQSLPSCLRDLFRCGGNMVMWV